MAPVCRYRAATRISPSRPARGCLDVRTGRIGDRVPVGVLVLSRSLKTKMAATCGASLGFCLLYEVTMLDSRYAARQAALQQQTAIPAPGINLRFAATAYCRGETTAAGTAAQTGVA